MFSTLAEGSRLDLNFVCSIAPCNLMRELQAYKGGLPSPRAWTPHRSPAHCLASRSKTRLGHKQSALALRSARRTATTLRCDSASGAKPARCGAKFAQTEDASRKSVLLGTRGTRRRSTPKPANRAPRYQRPQPRVLGAWEQPKKAPPCCRQSRREEPKIAARTLPR